MDAETARRRFWLENAIRPLSDADADNIYKHDASLQKQLIDSRPWTKDPAYFKKVKISALALIKMVMHARSGGQIEVMGMMQGRVVGDTMVVMDSFALPVEGTETRVNAHNEANEYMVMYTNLMEQVGRKENVVGWYHSHPGYGCWLSGIDVATQMQNQKYLDPFIAIVVDPVRTASAGKVELGAFRTYPEGYTPPDEGPSEYQSIPLSKIEDFGVHCKQYYPLEVSYFKNKLDNQLLELLWNKYWVNTLSSTSMLLTNKEFMAGQIKDISEKLENAEHPVNFVGRGGPSSGAGKKSNEDQKLDKAAKDSAKITVQAVHGVLAQVVKNTLFNAT